MNISITILVENSVPLPGLQGQHGLSYYIQYGPHKLIFDTGQTELLLQNADALGLELHDVGAIVLSHGHYDHAGGLAAVCKRATGARLFLHPRALEEKFSARSPGEVRSIGMPDGSRRIIEELQQQLVFTKESTEVFPGLSVTGEIPRQNDYEDTGGNFYLDAGCRQEDPLVDDQAMFIETAQGIVVLLGCTHAGVINTLEHVRSLVGGRPLHAVLGGMHLLNATPERMDATIAALREWDIKLLAPMHCTGAAATALLSESFPGRCHSSGTGTTFRFAAPSATDWSGSLRSR